MPGSSLVRINAGFYVSMDNRYSIQYFSSYRSSGRGWVISFADGDGYRSAIEHAPTLEAAQARYFELVAA
jgi:hypothetical protein